MTTLHVSVVANQPIGRIPLPGIGRPSRPSPYLAGSMEDRMLRLRAAANAALSRYEPLALVVAPLLTLLLARSLHALFLSVREKGIKAAVLGFLIASVK